MNRTETEDQLRRVAAARKTWGLAHTEFFVNVDTIMRRLIHEGIANRMSAEQVASLSGVSVKHIRQLMRTYDLDPKGGKQMLSRKAAETLANNAELLGIDPVDMDLMSPLAYLPAGSELRKAMAAQGVSQVTEVSGNDDAVYEVAYLLWQFNQGYVLAEDRVVGTNWMRDEVMHEDDARDLPGWLDAARQVIALVKQ